MKLAGYTYLVQELDLSLPPLGMELGQGEKSKDEIRPYGSVKIKILAKSKKTGSDIFENIETAINYQGVRLAYLVPIFEKIDSLGLTLFIKKRPKSVVRRCIWYLYEWLMSEKLEVENSQSNYAMLLDDRYYFTASNGVKNSRTRIVNNLLGNKKFCPMVRKTKKILSIADKNIMDMAQTQLNRVHSSVSPELLGRSIEYLYTKETKSSSEIENEQLPTNKMRRFYRILKTSGAINLSKHRLLDIQNEIVHSVKKDDDYREEEIYVGETRLTWLKDWEENIHFIGPKYNQVPSMMEGLLEMHQSIMTEDLLPPLIHASIMSFGFVYIHPFSDGNGRIHRYLIHDILKSRISTEQDFIIPVSATILQRSSEYDEVLEKVSKPIMALIKYDIDEEDHSLTIKNDIHYMYRYLDLTAHVEFLFEMMETSILQDLIQEVLYIIKYDAVKKVIEERFDIPNKELNLFIQLSIQNNGKISNKKRKRFENWIDRHQLESLENVICSLLKDIVKNAPNT
jgi:Fic family protein